jgi:hypothetical protein
MNTSSTTALARQWGLMRDRSPCRVAFVHGTKTIYGMNTTLRQEAKFGDLGIRSGYEASIAALASDFSTAPAAGDTITISSVSKRILFVETDPCSLVKVIHYGDAQA